MISLPARPLAALAALLLVAGCAQGGTGATPTGSRAPEATPVASGGALPSEGAQTRFEVRLLDALRMEPAAFTVPAGVPVTFVVTNAGTAAHEFYLGDEAAQAAHEKEMAGMGGMMHDEPEGIGVAPGETKELTFTFAAPGTWLAGCHVAGHYGAGMVATITVQ